MTDTPIELLAERLHEWYLEAVKSLDPRNYNPDAAVPWEELNRDQKKIDRYIAEKILELFEV